MGIYKIAGLTVRFTPRYALLRERGEKYAVSDEETSDITINVADSRIAELQLSAPHLSEELCEYMLTGADFYRELVRFDGMLLHASAVALDGDAYLFSAKSGVGKSTHARLWLDYFGGRSVIINDDKPAVRIVGGRAFVFGTPFCGKDDVNENMSAPLKAVCFLEQSARNGIERLSGARAVYALLNQSLRPTGGGEMDRLMSTVKIIVNSVPVYRMKCTATLDAAEMAYNAINGGT
ncbi:MAG: hypothetical protein FWF05_03850 [Oscillospiraceae bacterium]|nr:hypothetical protein [Oscillospiraceae bacterium]